MSFKQHHFHRSLGIHQIRPTQGFALCVTLESSDNTYIKHPSKGVLSVHEQGTNLSLIGCVFHQERDDGSLGPPVRVRNPVFTVGK